MDDPTRSTVDVIRDGYLIPYGGHTRSSYSTDLRLFFGWLLERSIEPLDAKRLHIETYARELLDVGRAKSTVYRKLVVISGFFRYAEEEEFIVKSPARYVRRPRVPAESQSSFLDRAEMGRFVFTAQRLGLREHALACLLCLNGLRVSEACGARIAALGFADRHHTLTIVGKGDKKATVPLAPRTSRAVSQYVGERRDGPIMLNTWGAPMSRDSASKIVKKVARLADIDKTISPHSLRHSFLTAALDAGVDLRYVQHAARHADTRSTIRYDRTGGSLDKHAAYIVAAFIRGRITAYSCCYEPL